MFKPPVEIRNAIDHSDRIRALETELYNQSKILRKVRDKSTARLNRINDLLKQLESRKRKEKAERDNAQRIKDAAVRAGVWPLVMDELRLEDEINASNP